VKRFSLKQDLGILAGAGGLLALFGVPTYQRIRQTREMKKQTAKSVKQTEIWGKIRDALTAAKAGEASSGSGIEAPE
jgi:hypothetical protein